MLCYFCCLFHGLNSERFCIQNPKKPLSTWKNLKIFEDFPGGSGSKASAYNAGDLGSIPGSGSCLGERNGNPLQYSCLENPMDVGSWWDTVHGVVKSWTRLCKVTFHQILTFIMIYSKLDLVISSVMQSLQNFIEISSQNP